MSSNVKIIIVVLVSLILFVLLVLYANGLEKDIIDGDELWGLSGLIGTLVFFPIAIIFGYKKFNNLEIINLYNNSKYGGYLIAFLIIFVSSSYFGCFLNRLLSDDQANKEKAFLVEMVRKSNRRNFGTSYSITINYKGENHSVPMSLNQWNLLRENKPLDILTREGGFGYTIIDEYNQTPYLK